jgi:hypothetical protein
MSFGGVKSLVTLGMRWTFGYVGVTAGDTVVRDVTFAGLVVD